MVIEQFLITLEQNGWKIFFPEGGWAIATDQSSGTGIAIALLTEGLVLQPPIMLYPYIKKWDVIVLCSDGLDSALLKKVSPGMQFWFWDIKEGNIFPYPAIRNNEKLEWLLHIASGQYAHRDNIGNKDREKTPFITYILVVINIMIFLLMTLSGGSTNTAVLVAFGAKVNILISDGEVWRLITSNFLHIGFFHLAFNMYALWILGPIAEEIFGHWAYLGLYLLSGVGGTFASFLFSQALSAGASASIFGLLGALLIYSWGRSKLWRSGLGLNLLIVVIVNLGFGFIQPGIDNFAHLGGLITGIIIISVLMKLRQIY